MHVLEKWQECLANDLKLSSIQVGICLAHEKNKNDFDHRLLVLKNKNNPIFDSSVTDKLRTLFDWKLDQGNLPMHWK